MVKKLTKAEIAARKVRESRPYAKRLDAKYAEMTADERRQLREELNTASATLLILVANLKNERLVSNIHDVAEIVNFELVCLREFEDRRDQMMN